MTDMKKYAINPGTYVWDHPRLEGRVITDKITWHKPRNYRPNKKLNKIWFSESIGGRTFYVVRTITGGPFKKGQCTMTGEIW